MASKMMTCPSFCDWGDAPSRLPVMDSAASLGFGGGQTSLEMIKRYHGYVSFSVLCKATVIELTRRKVRR